MNTEINPLAVIDRILTDIQNRLQVRLNALGIRDRTGFKLAAESTQGITPQTSKATELMYQRDKVVSYRQSLAIINQNIIKSTLTQSEDNNVSIFELSPENYHPCYQTIDQIQFFHSPWNHEWANYLVDQLFRGQASNCRDLIDKEILQHGEDIYQASLNSAMVPPEVKILLKTDPYRQSKNDQSIGDLHFFLTNLTPAILLRIARTASLSLNIDTW